MLRDKIIRAWKDPGYRANLSEEELSALPDHPAGAIELTDEELDEAVGGHSYGSYSHSQSYSRSRSRSHGQYASRSWRRSYGHHHHGHHHHSRSYSRSRSFSYRG
jgi:mersacidin/lichenicidin family type 2 lantibiotic